MDRATLHEEENLRLSWDRHPAEYLDRYLVSGVQDPRINGPGYHNPTPSP
ncbi:MAG: hypothetical protein ABFE01_11075 [Phycisphaerales bacterium]